MRRPPSGGRCRALALAVGGSGQRALQLCGPGLRLLQHHVAAVGEARQHAVRHSRRSGAQPRPVFRSHGAFRFARNGFVDPAWTVTVDKLVANFSLKGASEAPGSRPRATTCRLTTGTRSSGSAGARVYSHAVAASDPRRCIAAVDLRPAGEVDAVAGGGSRVGLIRLTRANWSSGFLERSCS